MSGPVPTVTALQDIYTAEAVPEERARWERLLEKFQATYGGPAEFVSRSPGRVNIIGEHIDYSLYSSTYSIDAGRTSVRNNLRLLID